MSWQVQDLSCYNSFEMEASQDTSLSVSLLIPLDEEHKSTGAFRLVIFGGDSESVPILAEDVFTDLPEPLHGLYLNLPCSSSRLRLPDNCTTCLWVDAEQLIRNVSLRINFQSFIHIYHSTQLLSNRSTSDYRRYLISSFMQLADPYPARIRKNPPRRNHKNPDPNYGPVPHFQIMQFADPDPVRIRKIRLGGIIRIRFKI